MPRTWPGAHYKGCKCAKCRSKGSPYKTSRDQEGDRGGDELAVTREEYMRIREESE